MNNELRKISAMFLIVLMIFSVSSNLISYGFSIKIGNDDIQVIEDREEIQAKANNTSNNNYDLMITNRNNQKQAFAANRVAKNVNTGASADYDVLLTQDQVGQYYYCMEKGAPLMLYSNGGATLREFYYKQSNYTNLTTQQKLVLAYLSSNKVTKIDGIDLNSNNNREKIIQYYVWKSNINVGNRVSVPSAYANIINTLLKSNGNIIKIGKDEINIKDKSITINGELYGLEQFSAYKYTSQLIYRRNNGKGYIESNYNGCGQEMFSFKCELIPYDDETDTPKIKLRKVDASVNGLKGAIFEIYDEKVGDNTIYETSKNGYTEEISLELDNKYTIKEAGAPDGYKLVEDYVIVTVSEFGEIEYTIYLANDDAETLYWGVDEKIEGIDLVLTLLNEKEETPPTTPPTPPTTPPTPPTPPPTPEGLKQYYPLLMYIKGTAFLDGIQGKESITDGYYNPENGTDKGLKGIKVEIYDEKTNELAQFATKEALTPTDANIECDLSHVNWTALEKYGKATTYTDENGFFEFYGLNPSHTYYIVFTYDGMRYAEIKATTETGIDASSYNVTLENASKAIEIDRQSKIVDMFSEIGTYPYNYYSKSKGAYNIGYNQDDVEEAIQNGLSKAGNDYEKLYSDLSNYMEESIAHFIKDCQITAKITGLGNILSKAEEKVKADNGNYVYPVIFVIEKNGIIDTEIREGYTSEEKAGVQWAIFDVNHRPNSISYKDAYNKLYGYLEMLNKDIITNLPCANLGLQYRSTFDLALYNDVMKADVTINGVLGTYNYDKRAANGNIFSFGVNEYDLKDYYTNLTNGNVQALRNLKYNYSISSANEYMNYLRDTDIHYLSAPQATNTGVAQAGGYTDNNNSIYLTYKIRVMNQSAIKGTVTEVVDYYSNDFEVARVYGENGKEYEYSTSSIYDNRGAKVTEMTGFTTLYIKVDNMELSNNESQNIYVVLKMKDIQKTLTSEALDKGYKTVNYAEINGYKTQNGYIDIDSTPGNSIATRRFENGPYEDDENKSPTLIFKNPNKEGRTISGILFEDSTTGTWSTTATRQSTANNEFDETDTLVKGATVQLIEVLSDGTEKVRAQTNTSEKGEYKFTNIRPGNYVVRFGYGNTDLTALTTKNKIDDKGNTINALNIKSYNGESYENTERKINSVLSANGYWYTDSDIDTNKRYSDATDNAGRRKVVTDNFATLTNENAEILSSYKDSKVNRNLVNELENRAYMYATTDNMKLEMEYVGSKDTNVTTTTANSEGTYIYEYNIRNVDFGIVERSRAKLDLIKKVSYISLIDSTGKEITGGTYEDWKNGNIKYIKWILGEDGFVDMEIDKELISGATLKITYEITVKDSSEKGNNVTEVEVIDYVTNNLNYAAEYTDNNGKSNLSNNWKPITTKTLVDSKLVNSTSVNSNDPLNKIDVSVYQTILTATFKPGETKTLTLEKNLSSDDSSNFNYSNIVEILSSKNTTGRGDYTSIYGNLDPITYTSRQGNLYWDFIKGITSSGDNDTLNITENSGLNPIRIAEGDSASAEEVIITPPEGAKGIIIPARDYILAITALSSLIVGIILTKKYLIIPEE